MRVVVDSSVIIGVCLAGGRLGPLDGHELRAPAHLTAEVTSALREQAFRGEIPGVRALEALSVLGRLPITHERPGALAPAAFQIATTLGWAKTYDAEYVALAQSFECPLVTLDARLQRGASRVARIVGPTEL